MGIRKNCSVKTNPLTTVLGLLFVFVALALFIVPVFYEVKSSTEWFVPASIGILGLVLIGSPDTVFDSLSNLVKRKGDNL